MSAFERSWYESDGREVETGGWTGGSDDGDDGDGDIRGFAVVKGRSGREKEREVRGRRWLGVRRVSIVRSIMVVVVVVVFGGDGEVYESAESGVSGSPRCLFGPRLF